MTWPGANFPSRFLLVALVAFYAVAILRGLQLRRAGISVQQPARTSNWLDRLADGLNRLVPTLRSCEIIACAWPLPFDFFPRGLRTPLLDWPWLKALGTLAWAGALIIYVWAQASMGRNWRIGTTTDAALVTSGAFAWSRHPIYFAFALMAGGTFCVFPNGGFLILAAISGVLLRRQALREENALHVCYGRQYADYCQRTRRWLGQRPDDGSRA